MSTPCPERHPRSLATPQVSLDRVLIEGTDISQYVPGGPVVQPFADDAGPWFATVQEAVEADLTEYVRAATGRQDLTVHLDMEDS